jgi:hypothetical protein
MARASQRLEEFSARRPPGRQAAAPVALTAIPDRSWSLADGVLVEAVLRARLLGVRLLKIDATAVLAPADITARSPVAHDVRVRSSARSSANSPPRSGAAGQGLAQAVRRIDEGAKLLAESRRDGF